MKQTFDAIRWLASELLLRRGALEDLLKNGLDVFMEDCPYDDLTESQAETAKALMMNKNAALALESYWVAYDVGRIAGSIPDARGEDATAADNPWLD